VSEGRRRDHRQPVRRREHADHDAHGEGRARALGDGADFCRGLHSLGDLSPERRFICHFPEEREIWSIGSGYGGNALLGKKCFALRIASTMARDEGWLAEHMLILGVESPEGETHYIAAAFPSACGKTNLAMLVPPLARRVEGDTVGDDIAGCASGRTGSCGRSTRRRASSASPRARAARPTRTRSRRCRTNTIFTNVALTARQHAVVGRPRRADAGRAHRLARRPGRPSDEPAAHPNSRFTAPARSARAISPKLRRARGRADLGDHLRRSPRAKLAPLVYEARDWEHGVYLGATMASETTAAATGQVGVVRRDPMAMLPFCGYNMGDYFAHWLRWAAGSRRSRRRSST
jgi:phosphoenolpyruvate carboxykinase (GTP)